MNTDNARLLQGCVKIAEAGGEIIRRAWSRPSNARHKGPIDLVTETDIEVQGFLQAELGKLLPEAKFLGEEDTGSESANPARDLCWIVDPVDGTTNFVHRFPMVSCSIGLWQDGKPLFGVVNAPMTGELFSGGPGMGAFCNGGEIHVSPVRQISHALLTTGFPYDIEAELPELMRRLGNALPASQGLRRTGSAALDLCLVARGSFDAYFENTIKPWDIAGGIPILLAAGGRISDFAGNAYSFGNGILASNGLIHEAMLRLLA